ncbi:MAG: hypothetical protein U0V49_03185 [Saprospiraceae bacterium]
MGHRLIEGSNITTGLNSDSKVESDNLYDELSKLTTDGVVLHDELWCYWATCQDRFGIS